MLPILAAGFMWLSLSPFLSENPDFAQIPYLRIISLILAFIMLTALTGFGRSKLVLEKDKITMVLMYNTQILPIAAIQGFKQYEGGFYLIPFPNNKYKKISVNHLFEHYGELLQWAQQTLINLDEAEVIKNRKEILNNEEFGATTIEREQKLNKTKKLAIALNIILAILSILLWLLPHYYYELQVLICVLLPIIALSIYKISNGLIKLDEKPNSAHPNLFPVIMFPALILMLRALKDYTIFSFANFWMLAGFIFIAIIVLVIKDTLLSNKNKPIKLFLSLLGILTFSAIYTYGAIITTNATFYKAPVQTYQAKILEKRTSSGKTTYYYFKLSPWGPQKEIKEVLVPAKVFENKETGDSATIQFKSGFYNIPFYFVTE